MFSLIELNVLFFDDNLNKKLDFAIDHEWTSYLKLLDSYSLAEADE
jgi:hypothetical protein